MTKESGINITKAVFPAPFESGLEYNPPTRGVWNIVHTGMLIPESRQIFVCAQGCLRGVILTAAEMNAMDRMSWVTVSEQDLYDGTMEQDVIDGVRDIINRLDEKPKCVLIFLSCVHLFAGCDFKMIIDELSALFPQVHFIDCYMTPTMRKSISPDSLMRKQLYEPLEKCEKKPKTAAIIGCDRATDEASELVKIINSAGFELLDITKCKTYEEYLSMAESSLESVASRPGWLRQVSYRCIARLIQMPPVSHFHTEIIGRFPYTRQVKIRGIFCRISAFYSTPSPRARIVMKSCTLVTMPRAERLPRSLSLFTANSEISTQ